MKEHVYFVYILADHRYGTLYIGVTNDLKRRVCEHKQKVVEGFTKRYGITQLVYYEQGTEILTVIHREKCLKRWKRAWKIRLIEEMNPAWRDLYNEI